MSDCKCGENHEAKFREYLPEFLMIQKAYNEAAEEEVEPTNAVRAAGNAIVDQVINNYLEFAQAQGVPVREAIIGFSSVMFQTGVIVGARTRNFYNASFGATGRATEEEVEEAIARRDREQQEKQGKNAEIIQLLRDKGVDIPEDFDGEVVMGTPEDLKEFLSSKSASENAGEEEKDNVVQMPGLYL